jgi:hypothetical protein
MVHLLDLVPIDLCLVRPILIASPFHDVIIWSGYTLPYVGTRELRWFTCLRADTHRQARVAQQEHIPQSYTECPSDER